MALVVSFDHAGPGTSAAVWRAHPSYAAAQPLTLAGVERLVVVAAHPDDESLGAGGLTATAVALGIPVDLVLATDGEGSHPDSPTHPPSRLAERRRVESVAAATALGVDLARVHRLGLPDGGLDRCVDQIVRVLVELVGAGSGAVLVSPWRRDGHPDHEAAGRAAAAGARRTGADLWEYPVWFWHWGEPAQAPWASLRPFLLGRPAAEQKAEAIAAHRTQVEPLSALVGDEVLLDESFLDHFLGCAEHFVRTPAHECPDPALEELHERETDPWGVETRWYERRKRDLVLALLPRERFERTLEVGCSTGALAEALASRSGQVVAADSAPAALSAARERFAGRHHVSVVELDVPYAWPEGSFDLVVVSEVGYFLSPAALEGLVERVASCLTEDGVVVLCHWVHPVEGWAVDGEDVHRAFARGHVPAVAATYRDRDVEIRVHAHGAGWPDPRR